ncbi:facilitated trehalose transporter Tret1-like [Hyposmocoma kahamanoa]|uniref:facilitated trehalose transporter Tret1-like n=1 Tax=Hyposmocoma kahamanoa TaxID=1477025 RepID=UPI000E6D695B|nr:facilitated trehalose transporter Tret1-like [Hyposmocoma kahamanoa]
MAVAWISPVMVKLSNSADTVLSRPITPEEGSWLASATIICAFFVNALAAYLAEHWGRKKSIVISFLPKITACILYIVATEFWMLLLSRVFDGIAESMVCVTVPMYAAEVANRENRGALGAILQIYASFGVVLMLCIGPYVSYANLNIAYLCISVLAFVPTIFLPDSPYFLFSKGRIDECQRTLTFLRGSESLAKEEIKEYSTNNNRKIDMKLLLRNKIFLKTILIITVLGIGLQSIGYNAVTFYLQTILETSNTSIKSEIASVIMGFVQLSAAFCAQMITDRFGRKIILITTLFGMCLGLIGLGIFFKIKDDGHPIEGFLNYLPLISLILFIFCYSAGLGSTFWIIVPELLEGPTRAVGVTVALTTTTLSTFVTTKYFVYMNNYLQPATTYWIFAGICVVYCLFIIVCVPETKQKSFGEIQKALGAKIVEAES